MEYLDLMDPKDQRETTAKEGHLDLLENPEMM